MVTLGINSRRGLIKVAIIEATKQDVNDCVFASTGLREELDVLQAVASKRGWSAPTEKLGKDGKPFWTVSKGATFITETQKSAIMDLLS